MPGGTAARVGLARQRHDILVGERLGLGAPGHEEGVEPAHRVLEAQLGLFRILGAQRGDDLVADPDGDIAAIDGRGDAVAAQAVGEVLENADVEVENPVGADGDGPGFSRLMCKTAVSERPPKTRTEQQLLEIA